MAEGSAWLAVERKGKADRKKEKKHIEGERRRGVWVDSSHG